MSDLRMRAKLPCRGTIASLIVLTIAIGSCVDSTGPISLTPPTNVTVALVGPHSARVTWTPAPAPEIYYVESYSIFRDGTKVGESVTTEFTDNGLTEGTTYKYRVSAAGVGLVSELSAESAASAILIPDVTLPTVASTSPASGATGISLSSTVSATFSEGIDPATVNTTTFLLKTSGGALIPGTVAYTAATRTALFTPTSPLPNAASVSGTITTGIKDAAGNRLASDYSFSFTTRDEVPPTVVSASPSNGSSGVAANTAITVTFSEAMDASTINTSTVGLKVTSSGAPVSGVVTYDAGTLTATFTPASALSFGTGYTISVSTGAKDASGNALAAAFSSSFSTTFAPDTTPPAVVAVSPANGAAGVPTTAAIIVGFSEAMDASTITSSTVQLSAASNGASVAASVAYNAATNTATLTPSATLAFGAGYVVAVTTGARDLAGNGLASQFSSSFTTASAPDVTPPTVVSTVPANGAANVAVLTPITVTFSEAMNAATVSGSSVVLKVSATSAVVPGSVSYDGAANTATFAPAAGTLAYGIGYTLTVSGVADVAGNALAATFTSTFTTLSAPDLTPPVVNSSAPANGATAVARTVAPTVTFSEPMNAATINGSTVTLRITSSGTPVAGTVSYDVPSNTATFTPSEQLSFSTSYTIAVTTGVQDLAGNSMASPFSAAFTTVSNPDTTSPTVVSYLRLGRPGPPLENRSITTVTFSEPMDPATINASTVTLRADNNNALIPGAVTYDANTNTATFAASSPLSYVASGGTTYTLTVSTAASDLAGNGLTTAFTLSTNRRSYYQGTSEDLDNSKPHIHVHITFSQSGQTLGRAVECQPLPAADCDLLPQNQLAADAIGPLDDTQGGAIGIAATVTAVSGTFTDPGITFTMTLANGRTFTFTGTTSGNNTEMTGTLSGATLSAPVSILLFR